MSGPDTDDFRGGLYSLVEDRLVACCQVSTIESTYRWDGAIEVDGEIRVFMHTTFQMVERLKQRLVDIHPYEVPSVLVLPVLYADPAYQSWVIQEVRD